ncbi:MAG: HAMP domain-containing protein [Rubrivivax sp.]
MRALDRRLSVKLAAAIIGVAAAVLAAAGSLSLWLFIDAQMAAVAALQQLQAETAAASILHFVDDLESHLRWLIAPSWAGSDAEDRRVDALRALRELPAVGTLWLVDPQGREQLRVSRLGPDTAGPGADLSRTSAYAIARRQGRHVGPVYFQDGSEPYMTLHVSGTSPRQGSVVAEVNLKLIGDVVTTLRIGETGRAFVLDARGELISHPDISLVLRRPDARALPQVRAALQAPPSVRGGALVAGRDFAGREILSASATPPRLGWTVVTELPRAEALAPVHASVRLWLAVLLCGFVAAVVCGALIARNIVRPIETLTAGAIRIGSGALDHRIAITGSNEFAQLGERFNEMAGRLQAERAQLEEKVRARTRELARANEAKSRFLASASHDLRQPLHALSLFVDELRAGPTEARRMRLNDHLAAALDGLNGMFDAILDTSEIEAGAVRPSLSRFPLAPLLDTAREIFSSAAEDQGAAVGDRRQRCLGGERPAAVAAHAAQPAIECGPLHGPWPRRRALHAGRRPPGDHRLRHRAGHSGGLAVRDLRRVLPRADRGPERGTRAGARAVHRRGLRQAAEPSPAVALAAGLRVPLRDPRSDRAGGGCGGRALTRRLQVMSGSCQPYPEMVAAASVRFRTSSARISDVT